VSRPSVQERRIAKRRARVRRLHEAGKTIREIEAIVGAGHATVERDLRALRDRDRPDDPERDESGRFVRAGPMAGAEPR